MSKSNFVVCVNNGTTALLLEEDFGILKACPPRVSLLPEQALSAGVHWYVFMTAKRLWRASEDFLSAPIATDRDFDFLMREAGWQARTREDSFFVPYSNGPLHFKEEKKFIFSLTDLLFRAARVEV
ncbi:MAG: hypothetical protein WDZ56_01765 [Candidatus Paceibacterota bacterium]